MPPSEGCCRHSPPRATLPYDTEERAQLFRGLLAGRRTLVVLDDAAHDEQVGPLLPGGHGCAVIVTSRAPLGGPWGARRLLLRELSERHGLDVLARMVGRERVLAEPLAAARLVELSGGLPLVLRAIADRLVSHPHWSLEFLVNRLTDEGCHLQELAAGDREFIDSVARSYGRLPGVASRLFRHLGRVAGGAGEVTAGALPGLAQAEVENALEQLADQHLLQVAGAAAGGGLQRYRLLEPYRRFALSLESRPHVSAGL
ncbi:NB-ARC domain-containing protein [Streptomyces sp. NPDC041068]|uniref:NB-ARC domain-containing protein n=1 Tax=Streptomyces sp. NPDC041068 TaxID=3155130 RepID=UPI0033CB771B